MEKLSVARFFSFIAGVYIYQFVYIFVMLTRSSVADPDPGWVKIRIRDLG
jgi:hypothetical protein